MLHSRRRHTLEVVNIDDAIAVTITRTKELLMRKVKSLRVINTDPSLIHFLHVECVMRGLPLQLPQLSFPRLGKNIYNAGVCELDRYGLSHVN